MKNNKFTFSLIIGISAMCVVALVVALVSSRKPTSEIQREGDYYMVNYTAIPENMNSPLRYNNQEGYTIVSNLSDLEAILLKYDSRNSQLDDEFFKSNDVLLVDGLMGEAKIHSLEYDGNSLEGVIYYDCLMVDGTTEQSFSLFIIPIRKNLVNANIDTTCYPDRIY